MAKRAPLSKNEMQIVHAVWELGEATLAQVCEALAGRNAPTYVTVQTYLRRLEAKGYLKAQRQGRTKVYSAAAQRSSVVRDTVNDLVRRLFGGQTLPLWQHLVAERNPSPEELAELRALLDQYESSPPKPTK